MSPYTTNQYAFDDKKISRLPPLGAIFLSTPPPNLKSWIRPWVSGMNQYQIAESPIAEYHIAQRFYAKKADYRISLLPLTSNTKNKTVMSKLHCMSNL
jgi:hypothetical protein